MNRQHRLEVALETKGILETGEYECASKSSPASRHRVIITSKLKSSCSETVLVDSDTIHKWKDKLNRSKIKESFNDADVKRFPTVTVVNKSTFPAAKELIMRGESIPCCLNFASAKNPGGGFLRGSQAQEESLARASGLYSTLLEAPKYYEVNRKHRNRAFYEDLLIYSPNVPVFRNDSDELIENPWEIAIITMPAPNRGVILTRGTSKDEKEKLDFLIVKTLRKRIDMILKTAIKFRHRNLVLGAWGCGVFQNDPSCVATLFREALIDTRFIGKFDSIVFAVLCKSGNLERYDTFQNTFKSFPN